MGTVASVLTKYCKEHGPTISTGDERERQLRRLLAGMMDRKLVTIGQGELMAVLDGWSGATRNRYRSAITHFWRWSRQRGLTTLQPELDGHREASRDVVLSLDQLRALWDVAPARGDWRGFCRMLILTGARTGEVAGMRPADVREGVWRQPKTKNGTEHLVFLGPKALLELREGIAWTGKMAFHDMKTRWSRDAGLDPKAWRLHDIRRSFATALVEGGADPAVVDRHLNHVASATARGVARIYNRAGLLEARKALALRWERLLLPEAPVATTSGKLRSLVQLVPGEPAPGLLDLLNEM